MASPDADALCTVVNLLQQELPGLRALYLFGSANHGALRSDSDIDLAVWQEDRIPPERRFDLAQRCAASLKRDVDLVEIEGVPLSLQAQIVAEGRKLFVATPVALAFFENTILSRYTAFNEERRPLVEMVMNRGSIHG